MIIKNDQKSVYFVGQVKPIKKGKRKMIDEILGK